MPLLLRTRSQMIEAWARKNLIIENLEVFIDAVKNVLYNEYMYSTKTGDFDEPGLTP